MPPMNETAAPAGVEHNTVYVAIEISRKSWVIGIKSPVSDRIGLHTIEAADVEALQDLIERHRAKAERGLEREVRALNCCEAGYGRRRRDLGTARPRNGRRRRGHRRNSVSRTSTRCYRASPSLPS